MTLAAVRAAEGKAGGKDAPPGGGEGSKGKKSCLSVVFTVRLSVTDLCDKIKANFTVVTRIPSAVAQRIPYLLVVFNPAFF